MSGFTKQQNPVKIKDNLQAAQNKINMGMLTTGNKCSVANDTLSGNENYSSKMRRKQRHKTIFKEVSRPRGHGPTTSISEYLKYLYMKGQLSNKDFS